MTDIVIEPMCERHVESFRQALDAVARERKYLVFEEAPPAEATHSFVLGMIANGNPQLVALSDDRVVGWCDIRRLERPAVSHCGVLGMGIIDGFRDKGLGRRLINAALAAARSAGFHRVELTAHSNNLRAIALYEKSGFVHEGISRDAVRIDGRFLDSVNMALILD